MKNKVILTVCFVLMFASKIFAAPTDSQNPQTTNVFATEELASSDNVAFSNDAPPGDTGGGGQGPGAPMPIDMYQYFLAGGGLLLAAYYARRMKTIEA